MIYLDYAATAPLLPEANIAMAQASWANPASNHALGQQAAAEITAARATIAASIQADPRELIFTSGATEANNLAIQGAARFYQSRGRHLITVQTEHKAVLDTFGALEQDGFSVTYLPVDAQGMLRRGDLVAALQSDTTLVSIMQVNNETGVMQDLRMVADALAGHSARLHVDAAQGFAKLRMHWPNSGVDYLSVSAHKCYGPKGVGGLFVRRQPRARLRAVQHGGGQEQGLRSGTLSPALCAGFAAACRWQQANHEAEYQRMVNLRERLLLGLCELGAKSNTASLLAEYQSPFILNIQLPNVNIESVLLAMPEVAMATGSACASVTAEPSAVLLGMGLPAADAERSLRLSFGWQTTQNEVDQVLAMLANALRHLRRLAGG